VAQQQGGRGIDQEQNREAKGVDALSLEPVVEGEALLAIHGYSKSSQKANQICRTCADLKADFQRGQNRCMHGGGSNANGAEAGDAMFE